MPEKTADEILNAALLELAADPEIKPYLGYVAMPLQMVPADKTLAYARRIVQALRNAGAEI